VQDVAVACLADAVDHDDVAESGDATGVGFACVAGSAAIRSDLQEGAAVNVIREEGRRARCRPSGIGRLGDLAKDLGRGVAAADDHHSPVCEV
jgi:hypothetical protein